MNIPTILKDLQKKLGLSERELARRIGKTHESVNSWVNGDYEPTPATVNEILSSIIEIHNSFRAIKYIVEPELPELVVASVEEEKS